MALHWSRRLLRESPRCSRVLLFSSWKKQSSQRLNSSKVIVTVDDSTGIATMQMNRPPVNSLNMELLTEMNIALDKIHNEKSCRGLILTSTSPTVFSAGLDITEMYNPQPERLQEFWRTLQETWKMLYGSRLATVAAINGHSPAGGCLLSMSCDYRIMAQGKFTIGLNETLLGIIAPFWFQDTMVNTIGYRETERALQLGLLYGGEQALKVGLIDELVPPEEVMQKAKEQLKSWLNIPDFARSLTKEQLRGPIIQKLEQRQEADIKNFANYITKSAIQKALGNYLEMLKARQSSKKE